MTSELVRVPTVTLLRESLPKYTPYRVVSRTFAPTSAARTWPASARDVLDGSIIIAGSGKQCGPDPLSATKGAYFLKCGDFLIGSGLVRTQDLPLSTCADVQVLEDAAL